MEVVNPFILKNKERMIVFLDQLSNVTDPFVPSGIIEISGGLSNSSDTGKFYITIYINLHILNVYSITNRKGSCNFTSHLCIALA